MRYVIRGEEPGSVELAYTWLPTWVGMNTALLTRMQEKLIPTIQGRPLTEETLDEVNQLVIDFLVETFPQLTGMRDYLDGLKFIEDK
jgi:hypothetical protein